MRLSAHIQSHPHAAAPKGTHQHVLQLSSHKNARPSVRAPRTSVGSRSCCINVFFLPQMVAHTRCSSYPLLTNPPKTYLYQKKKILHTHLPNIHAFLTTIHLSLINFSLLTLHKCQTHHSKHTLTKLEVPPSTIVSKLPWKKRRTKVASHLGKSFKLSSIEVDYRHWRIDGLYFG